MFVNIYVLLGAYPIKLATKPFKAVKAPANGTLRPSVAERGAVRGANPQRNPSIG